MKLLHVADLHAHWEWFDWLMAHVPEYDAVCVAGDLLDMLDHRRMDEQVRRVRAWASTFLAKPLFVCSGNHDVFYQSAGRRRQRADWLRALARTGVTVDDQAECVGPYIIQCVPWESLPHCPGAEIVLCHAPPAGYATALSVGDSTDFGDPELAMAMHQSTQPPWLLLGGHVHSPRSWCARVDTASGVCWTLNPGYAHDRGEPNHITIDLDTRLATHVCGGQQTDSRYLV